MKYDNPGLLYQTLHSEEEEEEDGIGLSCWGRYSQAENINNSSRGQVVTNWLLYHLLPRVYIYILMRNIHK